jgi:hypothetical protein
MSNVDWMDYLEEEVRHGLILRFWRQKRGYKLYWNKKQEKFEVNHAMPGPDQSFFTSFREAYNWLIYGTPIKRK